MLPLPLNMSPWIVTVPPVWIQYILSSWYAFNISVLTPSPTPRQWTEDFATRIGGGGFGDVFLGIVPPAADAADRNCVGIAVKKP